MQPKNHYLSINDGHGSTIRGHVIYLQPKAERIYKHEAAIHMIASGFLFRGSYDAVYESPEQTVQGQFNFTSGKSSRECQAGEMVMMGTFVVKEAMKAGHAVKA